MKPSTGLTSGTLLCFEGFAIDRRRRGLYCGPEHIRLTHTPFKVLVFLAEKRGLVVSKEQLLQAVWGGHRDENTVEQAIRHIRRVLGDDKEEPRFIRTIPGEGYCFIAEVREVSGTQRESELNLSANIVRAADSGSKLQKFAGTLALSLALFSTGLVFTAFTLKRATPGLTVANPARITRSQTHILSPLLGDGGRIFYPQYESGKYYVTAVPAEGGESTAVPTGITNPELCDLNQTDGAMLLRDLVHTRDEIEPLYVKPKGGPAQRLGDVLAYDAAWFPDGQRILFSINGVVYATDREGRLRQELFSVPGNAFWFRWSEDGKRLRFTVIDMKSEETSIWEVADRKRPRRLFPELKYHLCCGSWTPDGEFFVFQVRIENTFQIWAERNRQNYLPSFQSRPFPVASGSMSYRGPLLSKDGRKLFVRAEAPKGELVRYDLKAKEFIPMLPAISARTIAFSEDKKWIAYTSLADNQLWRCRSDGTECLELTQGFKNTVMPRWSPDGQAIAFMGIGFEGDWRVFVVSANGGTVRSISQNGNAKGYPEWSPDGLRLAFSDVPPVSQPGGIYMEELKSHTVSALPESSAFFLPRWSPDGRFLVALHSGDLHLYLFDFASRKWRVLAEVPACYPNWSHDSKQVYFLPDGTNNRAIFRITVANGSVEKVASLASVERGPFFLGDWIGLAPDDSPIAVRNMTTEDVYAWDIVRR